LAGYAEAAIGVIRKRFNLSGLNKGNWVAALPKLTWAINHSPCVSIGDLAPADVKSPLDEPMVRAAQAKLAGKMSEKSRDRYFPKVNSYEDMLRLSKDYELKPQQFVPGDFVYKDDITEGTKALKKGTVAKRGVKTFIIDEVLKNRSPLRYKLLDLNFKKVVSSYYAKSLRKVPIDGHPTSRDFVK
jgi:hypothetical protein